MKNEEHYRRVKIPKSNLLKPIFTNSNWWQYLVTVCLLILIGPLIPLKYRKFYLHSAQEYIYELVIIAAIVFTYVGFEIWFGKVLPHIERKRGYYFIGKFEIVEKRVLLGLAFLKLKPGIENKIRVEWKLFKTLKVGDVILVERTTSGSIKKIYKISDFYNRVKRASLRAQRE